MGFPSRLAVAAWAVGLTTTALGLTLGGCAREPGDPLPDTRVPVNASDLVPGRCIDQCEPDYGSAPVDCAAEEAGLEFFPAPVWNFDAPTASRVCADDSAVSRPIARSLYAYSDNTTEYLRTDDCACEDQEDCDYNRFEPSTEPIERCGVVTNALHVRGGPFREWGGGVGRRLVDFATEASTALGSPCPLPPPEVSDPATPSFCPKADPRIDTAPGLTRADGGVEAMNRSQYYAMVVDLREWEGISFWARRGPDSQGGFRVAIGDRNTDDDISFLEYEGGLTPHCSRVKECGCQQQDKFCLPRNPSTPNLTWCWDPAAETLPDDPDAENYERCGEWSCDQFYSAFTRDDLAFTTPANSGATKKGTNTCAFHAFATDQTGHYCYDPVNGPPPAEGTERCGDAWMDPVALSPDWKFYRIPFAELRQEGWAKRFPRLDVGGVTMVRFTWSVGWVDYWIDDVRFYRRQK